MILVSLAEVEQPSSHRIYQNARGFVYLDCGVSADFGVRKCGRWYVQHEEGAGPAVKLRDDREESGMNGCRSEG